MPDKQNYYFYIGNNGWFYLNGHYIHPIDDKHRTRPRKVTQKGDKLYVDGYEWTGNVWRRSIKALWYYIFG